MSYPKDLDEYSLAELEAEIARRKKLLSEGKCSYCEQPLETHSCKYCSR